MYFGHYFSIISYVCQHEFCMSHGNVNARGDGIAIRYTMQRTNRLLAIIPFFIQYFPTLDIHRCAWSVLFELLVILEFQLNDERHQWNRCCQWSCTCWCILENTSVQLTFPVLLMRERFSLAGVERGWMHLIGSHAVRFKSNIWNLNFAFSNQFVVLFWFSTCC